MWLIWCAVKFTFQHFLVEVGDIRPSAIEKGKAYVCFDCKYVWISCADICMYIKGREKKNSAKEKEKKKAGEGVAYTSILKYYM